MARERRAAAEDADSVPAPTPGSPQTERTAAADETRRSDAQRSANIDPASESDGDSEEFGDAVAGLNGMAPKVNRGAAAGGAAGGGGNGDNEGENEPLDFDQDNRPDLEGAQIALSTWPRLPLIRTIWWAGSTDWKSGQKHTE